MKIHQLPQGARFEYEGSEYVKTGPLSGTGKEGHHCALRLGYAGFVTRPQERPKHAKPYLREIVL
ncbi:MAG: hypothetical protein NT083_06165 [Rhodocyclales bacterium]|nr:hypothetical protein [Rhodocyclales bacterium]